MESNIKNHFFWKMTVFIIREKRKRKKKKKSHVDVCEERGDAIDTDTLSPHGTRAARLQGNESGGLHLVRLWRLPLMLWREWHVSCQDHEGWPPLWNRLLESSVLGFAAPVDSSPSAPEASPAAFFICLWQLSPPKKLLTSWFPSAANLADTSWLHDIQIVCTELPRSSIWTPSHADWTESAKSGTLYHVIYYSGSWYWNTRFSKVTLHVKLCNIQPINLSRMFSWLTRLDYTWQFLPFELHRLLVLSSFIFWPMNICLRTT